MNDDKLISFTSTMKQKYIHIAIVLILETITVLVCSYGIWKLIQKFQKNKQTTVIRIEKKNLLLSKVEGLEYFYEPKPNSIREDNIEWLKTPKKQYINSDSIHSVNEFTVNKKPDTYRIMTLGDSFTYGLYVNTNENWPERLEKKLKSSLQCPTYKEFEIINLGFPGYDIQHSVYRYKIRGKKYNPDLIIWLLKEDDFTQFTELSKKLADEKTSHKKYASNQERIDDYIKYLDQSVKEISDTYPKHEVEKLQNDFFHEFSSLFPGTLLITTMPYTSSIYKNLMQSWIKSRNNSYFLDNFPNQDLYKYPDGHPNTVGHQNIADITYEALAQTVFADCKK